MKQPTHTRHRGAGRFAGGKNREVGSVSCEVLGGRRGGDYSVAAVRGEHADTEAASTQEARAGASVEGGNVSAKHRAGQQAPPTCKDRAREKTQEGTEGMVTNTESSP